MQEADDKQIFKILDPRTGKQHEIPVEGSLGLLALGAVGLKAWRLRRAEEQKKKSEKKDNGKTTG